MLTSRIIQNRTPQFTGPYFFGRCPEDIHRYLMDGTVSVVRRDIEMGKIQEDRSERSGVIDSLPSVTKSAVQGVSTVTVEDTDP